MRTSRLSSLVLIGAAAAVLHGERHAAGSARPPHLPDISGVFTGSTPCDAPIRKLLALREAVDAHLMEWRLTLAPAVSGAPASYHLVIRYGLSAPGRPGLAPGALTAERRGTWTLATRASTDSSRVAYALSGGLTLSRITGDILHVLDADGALMVGNSGWSYTLNRQDRAEQRLDPSLAAPGPESRTLVPLPTGPTVYGIFEGRTPCQGIARELNIAPPRGCAKVKWRITLLQDPTSGKPTTYRVESGLHGAARAGQWSLERGSAAHSGSAVYRLHPAGGEPALFLLAGDGNVLFFLDGDGQPLTGHHEFSYTLNRR